MRLDRQKESELARRRGFATRTVVQVVWFIISGVIGYFVLRWLFDAEVLSYGFFYSYFGIPGTVSQSTILGALILLVVLVMQFFLILGYAFASPAGRQRPGTPSPYSSNPDPTQNDYLR